MPVSFDADIKPLFRPIDISHMAPYDILLDDYEYMSDATGDYANAKAVLDTLMNRQMPPDGPFWSQDQLDLFVKWMSEGYQP
jgi:hypothetical protein